MIGIDIGMSGAIAVIQGSGEIITIRELRGNDDPRRSTVHLVATEMIQAAEEDGVEIFATIEEPPQVRPDGRQTNAAAITGLWREFGLAVAACELNGIEFGVVPPVSWQSSFWSKNDRRKDPEFTLSPKDMARKTVAQLWPSQNWVLRGSKEHDGAIDASLIALYGVKRLFADKFERSVE